MGEGRRNRNLQQTIQLDRNQFDSYSKRNRALTALESRKKLAKKKKKKKQTNKAFQSLLFVVAIDLQNCFVIFFFFGTSKIKVVVWCERNFCLKTFSITQLISFFEFLFEFQMTKQINYHSELN